MNKPTRVVVAMSGGVDSSVAAALLLQQGYQVIGMMLRAWSEAGREAENRCCAPDAMAQARRVAALLGIPFYVVDVQQTFYDRVVKYFIDGYSQGITPNPCLVCNRTIRWEFLLERALAFEADLLATGHYVRLQQDESGIFRLLKACDPDKDQSYVLHVLGQEQLAHAAFPLGDYTKSEVRQLARDFGLPVAERSESQDLCFLGKSDYRDFLIRNAPQVENSGPILRRDGTKVGEHKGLAFYTIGQRKGIGVPSEQPIYVVDKDTRLNALIVGSIEELGRDELTAKGVNWVAGSPPEETFRSQVKIRYKAAFSPCTVKLLDHSSVIVHLDKALRDITPGQASVFYDHDIVLGGGIIQ
jgi:tRNA-specific 2-thiouridylase